ncbi:MAG: hypothetical protein CMF49_01825 [Legionellales bacterium]|nr:hypothetical protein [Legionellales bacterium]
MPLKTLWENKKFCIPLIILFLGISLLAVLILLKPSAQKKMMVDQAWPVTAMPLASGSFKPYIYLYGKIESPETSDLESVVEADVKQVLVREGELVEKGALLVELDDGRLKLDLTQKQAKVDELKAEIEIEQRKYTMDQQALAHEKYLLTLAEKQVTRQEQLKKTNAISDLALDQANEEYKRRSLSVTLREESVAQHQNREVRLSAQLNSAQAEVDHASMDVADTKIYAPFSGKITKVTISPGERVQVGEVLLQMFNKQDVEIRAQIPETYLEKARELIRLNQKRVATIEIDGAQYSVYLDRLSGEVGSGRAGIDGLFKVISNSEQLSIGRIIEMKFLLAAENDVYAVPETAIFDSVRVYKIENNHLVAVNIQRIGNAELPANEQGVLIKSPQLKTDDKILITPLPNAITGLKVNIIKTVRLGKPNVIEKE